MDVLYERCCGLDVHKKLVVACVITTPSDGEPERIVQSFGTMTEDLLKLGEWLEACGVSHVAMESTGVYWQPVWNLLEDRFTTGAGECSACAPGARPPRPTCAIANGSRTCCATGCYAAALCRRVHTRATGVGSL